jgi:hypothetical protein
MWAPLVRSYNGSHGSLKFRQEFEIWTRLVHRRPFRLFFKISPKSGRFFVDTPYDKIKAFTVDSRTIKSWRFIADTPYDKIMVFHWRRSVR